MSDSSPLPKPGSLRDRIAAFEQKPSSAPAPPAPRPKPGNLSQWKPRPPSPQDTQPVIKSADASMSAGDAKVSTTKAGSLKERMAALQGLGAWSFRWGSHGFTAPKAGGEAKVETPSSGRRRASCNG
jgi:myosin tail region-interacting protein MTI1